MADEDKSKDAEGKKTPAKKDPVDPLFYFQKLKGKKQKCSDETLNGIYANCLTLMEKYNRTGQIDAMKKLLFHLETIERERKVIAAGIDVFVYLDDIKQYINDVGDKVVKIIELDRYEREVPDEIVAKYEKVKDIFDRFIVVFTDYTKQHTEKTQKARKSKTVKTVEATAAPAPAVEPAAPAVVDQPAPAAAVETPATAETTDTTPAS